jgi:O-antigen/teichoic acid export membrane protein
MKIAATSQLTRQGLCSQPLQRLLVAATGYMGAQGVIYLAKIVASFLLLRTLTRAEFGLFTIVTGAMGTIAVLADSGLGSAFTALGGKNYDNPPVFSGLACLIRKKRLKFLLAACCLLLPLTGWALHRNGASVTSIPVLLVVLVLTAIPATDAVVLMTVNKLFRRVRNIVAADLLQAMSKLGMVVLVCLLAPSALGASLCVSLAVFIQVAILRHQTSDILSSPPANVDALTPQIRHTVSHAMPTIMFNGIQAQLATYILTFNASVHHVADLGALMRIAVLFNLLSIPLQQIFLPRIARCQSAVQVRQAILSTLCACVIIVGTVFLAGCCFSGQILNLFGMQYAHLGDELVVFWGVSAITFLSNAVWGVALTRAWITYGWVSIPITICLQLAAVTTIDLTSTSGVILFSAISQVTFLLVGSLLIVKGFLHEYGTSSANMA